MPQRSFSARYGNEASGFYRPSPTPYNSFPYSLPWTDTPHEDINDGGGEGGGFVPLEACPAAIFISSYGLWENEQCFSEYVSVLQSKLVLNCSFHHVPRKRWDDESLGSKKTCLYSLNSRESEAQLLTFIFPE
ncbi:hypothetical protein E2542_SST02291 [Spatholobus suberectus]|nr:hypothetical protein E2542_SST02291 [Spatholobus suberectus]